MKQIIFRGGSKGRQSSYRGLNVITVHLPPEQFKCSHCFYAILANTDECPYCEESIW